MVKLPHSLSDWGKWAMNELDKEQQYTDSYRAWMKAALDVSGGKTYKLHKEITSDFGLNYDRANGAALVRTWYYQRATLPNNDYWPYLSNLISFIDKHVHDAPVGAVSNKTFSEIVESLRKIREQKQKKGRKNSKIKDELYSEGYLSIRISKVSEIDEIELSLGSNVFSGNLPPYISREIDDQIIAKLNDDSNRYAIIAGPPKAGKTRTLIETLKKSKLAELPVYWVSPDAKALRILSSRLESESLESGVIVLDDIQRFNFSSADGLTRQILFNLSQSFKIVGTVHESSLSRWRFRLVNKASPTLFEIGGQPSQDIVELLTSNSINLNASLTELEHLTMREAFQGVLFDEEEFRHLGAELSSSKFFLSQALALKHSENSYNRAFFESLVDGRVMYPSGASVDQIKELFRCELHSQSQSPFLESEWIRLLTECTSAGFQSPHALLMRAAGAIDIYSLRDSVWEELKPTEWSIRSKNLDHLINAEIAANIGFGGFIHEAIRLVELREWPKEELATKTFLLGNFYDERGDIDCSIEAYEQSAALGEVNAFFNLGHLHYRNHNYEKAQEYWTRAFDLGQTDAALNLGHLLIEFGDTEEGHRWWGEAANSGNRIAMYNLAIAHEESGELEEAHDLFLASAELGLSDAMFNLGNLLEDQGDLEGAENWYVKASDAGDIDAAVNLGVMFAQLNSPKESEYWYLRAAKRGSVVAKFNLGNHFSRLGQVSNAVEWYRRAIEDEHVGAMFNLGNLFYSEGNLKKAEQYFKLAAKAGDADAMLNLGSHYLSKKQIDKAEHWFLASKAAGHPKATGALRKLKLQVKKTNEESKR